MNKESVHMLRGTRWWPGPEWFISYGIILEPYLDVSHPMSPFFNIRPRAPVPHNVFLPLQRLKSGFGMNLERGFGTFIVLTVT